jgi:MscS family membrane protein
MLMLQHALRALLLLVMLFPAFAAVGQDAPAADKQSEAPAPATANKAGDAKTAPEAAKQPAPTAKEIEVIEERIASLDEDIAAFEAAQPQEEGAPVNPQLEFMRRSRLLQQRRLSGLKRIQQLEEQLATAAQEAAEESAAETPANGAAPQEAEAAKPLSIQEFDQLLDDLDAAQRAMQSRQQAAASQEEATRRAAAARDNAAKARRAAEEAHQSAVASGGGGLTELAVLEEQRRAEVLSELQSKLEDILLRVAQVEVKIAEKSVTDARNVVREGALRLQFTTDSLEAILAETETRRQVLQERLDLLYREREKDSESLYKRRQQLASAAPEEEETAREKVAAAELALSTTNAGIQNLEKRLNYLAEEAEAWQMRAGLMRGTLQGSRPRMLTETREKLDLIRAEIQRAEARGRDVIASRLVIQERLANPELPEALRSPLQKRITAIDEQDESDREFLTDLTRQEKLLRRLEWSLNREVEEQGLRAAWSVVREYFLSFWYYELFVFEDRGYTVSNIFYALMAYAATLSVLLLVRRRLRKMLVKFLAHHVGENNATVRDVGLTFINGTSTLAMMVFSVYPTLQFLPLGERARAFISSLFFVAIMAQIALYVTGYMERAVNRHKIRRLKEDPSSVSAYGVMSFFGRIAIWSLVGLVTLDSFGVDITTFVAGLGVGGIAVAFALQSILADIFSSVAILLDKPFVVGDVITVGDNTGEVQSIGLKTTRLKSVSGEQVVISNNDLLSSRIHNFKRMSERRILFTVQVTYATKLEQLELIPKILQEAVEQHEQTRFRRAHFKAFGDFSLIFECEYFMLEPDHMLYINTHQAVNLHIFKRFHEEGIEFANSTQTHLAALDLLPPTLKVSADHTPPKNNG